MQTYGVEKVVEEKRQVQACHSLFPCPLQDSRLSTIVLYVKNQLYAYNVIGQNNHYLLHKISIYSLQHDFF